MSDITHALPARVTLYEFPHSHFCEMARWGLACKDVAYRSVCLLPGFHAPHMRRLAGASSVPVLQYDDQVVQGASAILDFLQDTHPVPALHEAGGRASTHRFEADLARDIGEPLRRLCYYHLLPDASLVRYFFMHRSSLAQRAIFALMYPITRRRIRDVYDCTAAGAERAQRELTDALARYDALLDSREYFYDGQFSRADLSFAAMLVFMVMPPQYPVAWPAELADHPLTRWFAGFRDRATYRHVARIYARHRPLG